MNYSSASILEQDTLVKVAQFAIRYLKLSISDTKIEDLLLKHPDYPNISSISGALSSLNIKNKAVRINSQQLQDLNPCFFAFLMGEGLVFVMEISLGQTASHAPVNVHEPKPSLSICSTMASTRFVASTFPCGNSAI